VDVAALSLPSNSDLRSTIASSPWLYIRIGISGEGWFGIRSTATFLRRLSEAGFQAVSDVRAEGHGGCIVGGLAGRQTLSAKPWKGLGSGVYELIEDERDDTYRAVYTVWIADSVHVLHTFQKKSKSGIATPKPDVDLVERRFKALLERYRDRRS
jgi:hypothetical protein